MSEVFDFVNMYNNQVTEIILKDPLEKWVKESEVIELEDQIGKLKGISKRLSTSLRHLRAVNDNSALEITNILADIKDILGGGGKIIID